MQVVGEIWWVFLGSYHFAGHGSHGGVPASLLLPSPDQPSEILSDYIQQATVGRDLITHIITYKCDDQVPLVSSQDSPRLPSDWPE